MFPESKSEPTSPGANEHDCFLILRKLYGIIYLVQKNFRGSLGSWRKLQG